MRINTFATQICQLRILIPIVLALAGATVLIGCFSVERREKIISGTDYRPLAGEDGRLLQNGQIRREQIEAKLGRPQLNAEGVRFAGYLLHTDTGFWFNPLCFNGGARNHFRLLKLEYDKDGTLIKHEVATADAGEEFGIINKVKASDVTKTFPDIHESPQTQPTGAAANR